MLFAGHTTLLLEKSTVGGAWLAVDILWISMNIHANGTHNGTGKMEIVTSCPFMLHACIVLLHVSYVSSRVY